MLLRRLVLACVVLVASASSARADLELKNDGFVSGAQATFQTGFVSGEAGAVRFVAPSAGRQLTKVQLLFGGAATMKPLTIKVFDDSAGTDAPGNEIYMGDIELTGADNAMQELDLSQANVFVPAQFRIAFIFQHAGAPSIANDADGTISADRNFILDATGWKKSSSLGLTGDWVIRAFVTDSGGSPDAGPVGSFCDTDPECGNGRYCDVPHHACTLDCQGDSECPNGGRCDDTGRCTAGSGNDDGGCQASRTSGFILVLSLLVIVLGSRRRRRL
jgi:hypothetical protein